MDFGPRNFDRLDHALTKTEKSSALKAALSKFKNLVTGLASPCGSMVNESKTLEKPNNLRMIAGSVTTRKHSYDSLIPDDHYLFVGAEQEMVAVADGLRRYVWKLLVCAQEAGPHPDPKYILREAVRGASHIPGSARACILTHRAGVVRAVNVGDTGFLVFRSGDLLTQSCVQYIRRSPSTPRKLGHGPEDVKPSCADEYHLKVVAGDVVVVANAGVLDNLFVDDIEALVARGMRRRLSPQVMAEMIAKAARVNSVDNSCSTPWSTKESASTGRSIIGGKRNDVTVVVGLIVDLID